MRLRKNASHTASRRFNHEAHDLVGGVHDAQAVRGLGVINFVKILVNGLQKRLLLVVSLDL